MLAWIVALTPQASGIPNLVVRPSAITPAAIMIRTVSGFSTRPPIDGFSTWMAHYPASGITIVQMINSQSADLNVDAVEAAVFPDANGPCLGS